MPCRLNRQAPRWDGGWRSITKQGSHRKSLFVLRYRTCGVTDYGVQRRMENLSKLLVFVRPVGGVPAPQIWCGRVVGTASNGR